MTRAFDHDLVRRFATRAVHAGQAPDPLAGAVMTPIYQTSTYIQDGLGRNKGYEYARTRNPTREALERNVAALEGGRHGFAFGSGLAAVDTVLKLLSAGDHVVCGENVYGGTHRQMTHIWARLGLTFTFVDGGELSEVKAAITKQTKIVYAETPTNPMMRLCDLAATGEIAHRAGALFVVDNTFATPCFQRPLELGADIVLHSTTKYLNGHSDMVGGLLITTRDDLAERIGFLQNSSGAVPGPPASSATIVNSRSASTQMLLPVIRSTWLRRTPCSPSRKSVCRPAIRISSLDKSKSWKRRPGIFCWRCCWHPFSCTWSSRHSLRALLIPSSLC